VGLFLLKPFPQANPRRSNNLIALVAWYHGHQTDVALHNSLKLRTPNPVEGNEITERPIVPPLCRHQGKSDINIAVGPGSAFGP
jgi:hypothetical protein